MYLLFKDHYSSLMFFFLSGSMGRMKEIELNNSSPDVTLRSYSYIHTHS